MAALTLRATKGSPLTNSEVDANFSALNTELGQKVVASLNLSDLANSGTARINLGIGNVENKSSATIRGEITSANVTTALGYTPPQPGGTGASGTWGISISGTAKGVNTVDPAIGTGGLWVTSASGLNVARNGTSYLALDAGNYTSYSPTLTGAGASGSWGISVTGTAGSVAWANVSGKPSQIVFATGVSMGGGINWNSYTTAGVYNVGAASWAGATNAPSSSYSFGSALVTSDNGNVISQIYLPHSGGMAFRSKWNATDWQAWRYTLDSGNFNSYSPTLTGGGASGTWGISVTGSAASVPWSGVTGKPTTLAGYGITDAALSSHTHSYLPLSGGSLSGSLDFINLYPSGNTAYGIQGNNGYFDTVNSGVDSDPLELVYVRGSSVKVGTGTYGSKPLYAVGIYDNGSRVLSQEGNSYYQVNTWLQLNGTHGLYWPSYYGAHLHANDLSSYTPIAIRGSKGGYQGICMQSMPQGGGNGHWMSNGNGTGYYNESYGWKFLHENGNFYIYSGTYGGGTQYTALHSGNYNSYSPTLSGSGASGTWGISVTGNAATAYGLNVHTGRNNEANKVVRTDVNGYLQVGYINSSSGNEGNNSNPSRVWGTNGSDDYLRSYLTSALSVGYAVSAGSVSGGLTTSNFSSYAVALTSASRPGVYKLYRNESDDPYNVQTTWSTDVSGYWSLRGFNADTYHAPCYVGLSGVSQRSNRANGNFYIDDNYGNTVVGAYSATRYQGVFAMGDSYKLPADGTSTGSLYGMAWSHPNAGGAAGNLSTHGLLIINNGFFCCAISTSIVAASNITAYSDERLKTNWRNMPENYVERLAQIKVGIYDRIDQNSETQVGVSAQSLQKLLPEAVIKAKDEMETLSVSYGNAALASCVMLSRRILELEKRLAALGV